MRELHRRQYGWEALHGAGLGPANFTAVELVEWLRRDRPRFVELLRATSLGESAFGTEQLLRALSKRGDLGQALAATGLGAGSDFNCAEDENARDGGCQVRCRRGRAKGGGGCERAHALCRKLPHCVKVDANRDGTWATLKSLTVFAPPPVAACEGYAFRLDGPGGAPNPFAAPPVADFSFDDVPSGAPDENWCYRGTTVDEGERRRFRRKQPGHACTMETCFDATRCEKRFGLHVGEEVPRTHDMMRLPDCLRQCARASVVTNAAEACVLLPTVNINCEWDQCDPSTHMRLRALPSWGAAGRNHLIWDYNDAKNVKYRTDDAIFMKTAMSIDHYRRGFDVPMPLLPNGVATRATAAELAAAAGRRHLLLSFKGVCQPSSARPALSRLHNGRDIISVCTGGGKGGGASAAQYDYKALMLSSVFSAAPAGNGLHSYRLAESIFLGAIPVIVDEKLVLPFCSVLDWSRFSVRVKRAQVPELPAILRAIPPAKVAAMQRRLAEVKERYFLYPFSTALALVRLRAARLRNATAT